MEFTLKAQLKVFSTICANLVVVWIGAAFTAGHPFVLTMDILAATMAWYIAVWTEIRLEEL